MIWRARCGVRADSFANDLGRRVAAADIGSVRFLGARSARVVMAVLNGGAKKFTTLSYLDDTPWNVVGRGRRSRL
jgi:hypothetical protein